ncbi:MAG: hypothetical protein QGF20_06010 [Alphaproteobacteria bacterium]|jgi:hypothetical protein|nr:hypothetical protein [Alphaproteobacteria bacterium]
MKAIAFIFAFAVLAFTPAAFAAEKWGIDGEEKARFEAKVVDIACELSGNCPANCGGGKRQLGLLRDDGSLLLVAKNFDIFAGAAVDLIGYCGRRIVADGLLIKSPKMPLFALQFSRLAPDGKWGRANKFTKAWSKANGAKKGSQWFRNDVRIRDEIAANGVFGIPGLEPDKE